MTKERRKQFFYTCRGGGSRQIIVEGIDKAALYLACAAVLMTFIVRMTA